MNIINLTRSAISTSFALSFLMAAMTGVSRGRAWPTLDVALFAAAFPLYALGMPLGLARVEAASQVAAGLALDTSTEPATYGLLAMRLAGFIPLGDQPLRANLASAVLCALALALLARLCLEILVLLRPPANARQDLREFLHEPIAASGAALAAGLTLSTFDLGTTGGSAAATLLMLCAGLLAGFALLRDVSSATAGYALAAISGLSAGVDAVAGPLLWPLLVGLAVWALHKGARWPLLAPLCFIAAWGGSALAAVACSAAPATAGSLFGGLGALGAHAGAELWATTVELGDEVGVVGALLAAVGLVVIGARAAVLAAWLALTLLSAILFAHSPAGAGVAMGPARAALPVAIAVSCVFASAGLLHVAGKLGRAHMAATLAMAVILVLSPAMDGGQARWLRRATLPMHLLDRALGRAEVRSMVYPGTGEMDGLFRLARAMGLRPDLVFKTPNGKKP
jgi:hypothetical protein